MSSRSKSIIVGLIFLTIGGIIGAYGMYYYRTNFLQPTSTAVREGGYELINPLLSCSISENKQSNLYKPINDKFKAYIDNAISNNDADSISVYFRSLDGSRWSGVNENVGYSPASLLKLPLMIAYLREADSNPAILQKEVTYHQTTDSNAAETFKPKEFIQNGETYTIADLLKYMIVYSDNNAAALLDVNLDKSKVIEVYSDLGIPITDTLTEEDMSPKTYSYIFRILYNATYLSRSMSQYALNLLTQVDFDFGLKADIPVPVAHKFGERSVYNQDPVTGALTLSSRELHDCGIVYFPKNPYLLCIMTKGQDFSKMSKIIGDISNMTYTAAVKTNLFNN